MKAVFPCTVAAFFSASLLTAQENRMPSGGGEHVVEKTVCVSPEQRTIIDSMLTENIRQLKANGILPPNWGIQSNDIKQKTTAGTFIWPLQQQPSFNYNEVYGISNFVDLNPAYPNQVLDWNCGSRTYDQSSGYNHAGIDIFLWPFSQQMQDRDQVAIIAAAPGVVIAKTNGYPDHSCSLSGQTWNAVYIGNTDGTICWYGHMKNNSQTSKIVGQSVAQGEFLGIVGSSGNSTGPHLHFETHDGSGNILDPYNGPCNTTASLWASQKPYYEPTVNALLTHSAVPVFPNCPTLETINDKDTFYVGNSIFFASYLHDQDDNLATYSIMHSSGADSSGWTHSLNPGQRYTAAYWYWPSIITSQTLPGEWIFKSSYHGKVVTHKYYVANTSNVKSWSDELKNLSIFPNPSKGEFTINGLKDALYYLQVTDVTGKIIESKQLKATHGQLKQELHGTTGIYFITLKDETNNSAYLKILLEK